MAIERLAPDSILATTNLSGTVTDIQDDPDSPDSNWLTAGSIANTDVRVSFPTPTNIPKGTQGFKIQVRKTGGTNGGATATIHIYVAGTLVASSTAQKVDTTTSKLMDFKWDIGTYNSADVELRVEGIADTSTSPSAHTTVEVGAIEWNAFDGDLGTLVVHEDFEDTTLQSIIVNNVDTDYPWRVTTSSFNGGAQSFESSNSTIQSTDSYFDVEYTPSSTLNSASLEFYYKVDSESGYDFFRFYRVNSDGSLSLIFEKSGAQAWTKHIESMTLGALNKFRFLYYKDGSVDGGADKSWVDDIKVYEDGGATPVSVTSVTMNSNTSSVIPTIKTVKHNTISAVVATSNAIMNPTSTPNAQIDSALLSSSVSMNPPSVKTSFMGYQIQRSDGNNTDWKTIAFINDNTINTYLDSNLVGGTTYYYRMRYSDGVQTTTWSSEQQIVLNTSTVNAVRIENNASILSPNLIITKSNNITATTATSSSQMNVPADIKTDTYVEVSTSNSNSLMNNPTITTTKNISVQATISTSDASNLAPTITSVNNVSITSITQDSTTNMPIPTVTPIGNVNILPSASASNSSAISPTINTVRNITISATTSKTNSSMIVPSVGSSVNVHIGSAVSNTTSAMMSPTIKSTENVNIVSTVSNSSSSVLSPAITSDNHVVIQGNLMNTTTGLEAPTIKTNGTITISSPTITLDGQLVAPTVKSVEDLSYPTVRLISISMNKISDETSKNESTITFKFDEDVTDYSVNVLGTSPDTGTVADSGTGQTWAKGTEIQAIIDWTELYQEGSNRINIYGKSAKSGRWTPYDDQGVATFPVLMSASFMMNSATVSAIQNSSSVAIGSVVATSNSSFNAPTIETMEHVTIESLIANSDAIMNVSNITTTQNNTISSVVAESHSAMNNATINTSDNVVISATIGNSNVATNIPSVSTVAHISVSATTSNSNSVFNVPAVSTTSSSTTSTYVARPIADISVGQWTPTPLWDKIDDSTADDTTTEITTPDNTGGIYTFEVDVNDMDSKTGNRVMTMRLKRTGSRNATNTFALYRPSDGTVIASFAPAKTDVGTSYLDYTYTLTSAEADSITDYTDLAFRMTSDFPTGGGPSGSVQITMMKFEIV